MDDIEKLKTENKKLTDIIAAKSDVISIGAHQLRTSLTALKWILKMFSDNDLGTLTDEQRTYIDQALTSNERMITLVSSMLAFNHTDGVTAAPKLQDVDIEQLTSDVAGGFHGETLKKNITLTTTKPAFPVSHITADPEMIRVVLECLVENAIKYSETSGKVTVTIEEKNGMIEVSVHNNGIVIGQKDKDHIFQKFFRAETVKDAQIPGSGLGLFIAQSIVQQHKGTLSFTSSTDAGTTFCVSLPVA